MRHRNRKTVGVIPATKVRWMVRSDLAAVMEVEESNSQLASPIGAWTRDDFLDLLGNEDQDPAGNFAMVAVRKDRVVGFVVYNLQPDKFHIYNFAVHADHLRLGVGTVLASRMKSKLRTNRNFLEVDVRESDLRSQLFLKRQDFHCIDIVRNRYEEPMKEDAYKFRYCLDSK